MMHINVATMAIIIKKTNMMVNMEPAMIAPAGRGVSPASNNIVS